MTYPLYKINGTLLLQQPESGKWLDREEIGIDGSGHPIYPDVRDFQLSWGYMTPDAFSQIQNFYDLVGNTGTVSADLPERGAATYGFHQYSGCTLGEPTCGDFFEEYYSDVSMKIFKITG